MKRVGLLEMEKKVKVRLETWKKKYPKLQHIGSVQSREMDPTVRKSAQEQS